MKKNLFFVFTMLCALSFFTACSDDDDNKTDDGWKAISATYTAETLKLTMGGTEVADQSVKVDASSAEQATITLANLIPGEAESRLKPKWSRQVKAMHWKEATRMICELSLQKEPLKPVF